MLTIKYKEIKNNAYYCMVSMVAFTEGYQVRVEVQYCTPYFRLLDQDQEATFLSREEAEEDFLFNVEWNILLSRDAASSQEKFMQKCMKDNSLQRQKQMEGILNSLCNGVPLELRKFSLHYEVKALVYRYFGLTVVEYFSDLGVGVDIYMNSQMVYSKYTIFEDGVFITPEEAIKDFLG